MQGPRGEEIATAAERAVRAMRGVRWAEVNPVLASIVVSFDDGQVALDDLTSAISAVEEVNGSPQDPVSEPDDVPEHPADTVPITRTVTALTADGAAFVAAFAGRALRAPALPVEAASVISAVESLRPARKVLERRPGLATGTALVSAVLQGLGQSPAGPFVDGAHRAFRIRELTARRNSWLAAEERLRSGGSAPTLPDFRAGPRPEPLPPTMAERYASAAPLAAVAAAGLTLALDRNPRRTADLLLAGSPRPARLGVEAFGAQIGTALSHRDVVVMNPRVLRHLDIIDTVVIDSPVLVRAGGTNGLDSSAASLVESVKRAAHDLVIAGKASGLDKAVGPDITVAGGTALARSIRQLQAEGRVVALVSHKAGAAMRAADLGIGIVHPEEPRPPWGADVICLNALDAPAVIDATRLARTAGKQAVTLAAVGSLAASLLAFGQTRGAARRAMTAIHLASAASMGAGIRVGTQLSPRPAVESPEASVPWHALDVDSVMAGLAAAADGLTEEEAASRAPPSEGPPRPGVPALVVKELSNPLTAVLGAGAAMSAAAGSMVDAALIIGVIGLDATIGVAQRLRTEAAIKRLGEAIQEGQVTVVRSGREVVAGARSLVSGDLISLKAGDAIPADARLIDVTALEVDESSLTGESLPVIKEPAPVPDDTAVADRASMVYAGTSVAAGRGRAVVVATGINTESRRAAPDEAVPETGVQARLKHLTDRSVPLVVAAGAGLTVNSLLRGAPAREALTAGVSLTASAVPEGLPFVATVAQAAAAHRLASNDILVRNPQVLEALGRVDVLCFDKTGTLTEGRLRLARVSDGLDDLPVDKLDRDRRRVLAAALRATPRARTRRLPHPTDQAVVDAAVKVGVGISDGVPGWKKETSLPFEPGRGYHAVSADAKDGRYVSVKGAPEAVLPRCSSWRNDGRLVPLDRNAKRRLESEVDRLGQQGLRVLAVAERNGDRPAKLTDENIGDLELIGFIGVSDEARATAAKPLAQLQDAGIRVVMITGDHPSTAEAVASDLGLINSSEVITGPQIDELDDEQLGEVIDRVGVFARVTPAHKVRIVKALQRAGRVVAMTGDGANDAQAIRLAHVGIAFGSRSTPAAQGAADVVIARDDLQDLIETMVEGRAMWASVRDALAILLGGNLGEVLFITGAAFLHGSPPLTARQLLTVNLFTDLVPAMVLAAQPPASTRVQVGSEGPETSLSGRLARDVALRAVATSSGAYSAWVAARLTGSQQRARTVSLAALVGTQLGQTMIIGRHSPLVIGSSLLSAAGLAAIIQTPGLSQFFGCRPLGPGGWAIALTAAAGATVGSVLADAIIP